MRIVLAILALVVVSGCASLYGTANEPHTGASVTDRNDGEVHTKRTTDAVHASGRTVDGHGRL